MKTVQKELSLLDCLFRLAGEKLLVRCTRRREGTLIKPLSVLTVSVHLSPCGKRKENF